MKSERHHLWCHLRRGEDSEERMAEETLKVKIHLGKIMFPSCTASQILRNIRAMYSYYFVVLLLSLSGDCFVDCRLVIAPVS